MHRRSDDAVTPMLVAAVVDDHVRSVGPDELESSDRTVVALWLRSRVGFAVAIPVFPDGTLREAHLCILHGHRGAAIEYRVGGESISYYVMPDGATEAIESPSTGAAPTLHVATRAGYHVVTWREPGLVHALVGAAPTHRLVTLAHLCIQQMVALIPAHMSRARSSALGGRRLSNDRLQELRTHFRRVDSIRRHSA